MARHSPASGKRERPPVWQVLNRLLGLLIVLAFLGLAMIWFIPEIQRAQTEKRELRRLENEILNQEELARQKKRELELLQTSPEYVEIIARDKMDLMKEGEVIFRIDSTPAPAQ